MPRDIWRPADYIFGAAIMNIGLGLSSLLQPYLSTLYPYTLAGPVGSLITGLALMAIGVHLKQKDHPAG